MVFTNKKTAGINTFVCAVSLYVAETPKASIKDHEPPLPIIPFGIVTYSFVGHPLNLKTAVYKESNDATLYLIGSMFNNDQYHKKLSPQQN